jgi:hypothetical protein
MASSAAHQTLLLWGMRSMQRDGFRVGGIDGFVEQAGYGRELPRPPTLAGVRPDAWGVHAEEELVAFVEAKSASDIDNRHTRVQLCTLGSLRMPLSRKRCPVYVVIPRGAAYALDRVLIDLDLLRAPHIRRLHVPGVLLEQ